MIEAVRTAWKQHLAARETYNTLLHKYEKEEIFLREANSMFDRTLPPSSKFVKLLAITDALVVKSVAVVDYHLGYLEQCAVFPSMVYDDR